MIHEYYDSEERKTFWKVLRNTYVDRNLILLLVKRELIARYRRSVLGIAWSLLTPISTSLVLYFVLSSVFKTHLAGGAGYAAFLLIGMMFNNFLNQGGNSIGYSFVSNSGVVTKIRTEPMLFPVVTAISNLVNYVIGVIPLILFLLFEKRSLHLGLVLYPAIGFIFMLFVLGVGLHVAILAANFHDIHGVMTVVYNVIGYATPIIYPLEVLNAKIKFFVQLNPMTEYVQFTRGLFLEHEYFPSIYWVAYAIAVTLFLFATSLLRLRTKYAEIVESL